MTISRYARTPVGRRHPLWVATAGARLALSLLALCLLGGCGSARARNAVPQELTEQAAIAGIPVARTWGDAVTPAYVDSLVESVRQEKAHHAAHPDQPIATHLDVLALSGGGEDGAFGAGLLCGWTKAGNRPTFKLVTGISTGALIAPLAFAGPAYDERLREYTRVTQKDICKKRPLLKAIGSDALFDTSPLRRMVERHMDEKLLADIAAEHLKGRRLFVGTTNLDAQRPVLWDLGAIAASGHPDAPELFRDVVIASAAIPGAFPPVHIPVEAGGKRYEEMHGDGGCFVQVVFWGGGMSAALARERLGDDYLARKGRMYVIRNSHVSPGWAAVEAKLFPIGSRAISTLIQANGLNDLARLHAVAVRDGFEFHLAYIPTAIQPGSEMFDKAYMNEIFDHAYAQAEEGYPWLRDPPIAIMPSPPVTATRPSGSLASPSARLP